jgi:GNAT superfamily N-acetyltransferase
MDPRVTLTIRPLSGSDSLEALTALLHRAYARLGAMGLNYTAVDLVKGPHDRQRHVWAAATEWYVRPDAASLAQLGIEPASQGQGIGQRLVAFCEAWARERGFRWLVLDTAVPATHLCALYERLGFRDVDEVQWEGKRYRSTIMAKEL